jgi:hypothetical protein
MPIGGQNLVEDPYVDLTEQLFFAVSDPVEPVTLTSSFQEFVFNFPVALPANSADLFLTVVYRGPLGLEPDAVMIGGKDLYEPDPLDVGNASDWECAGGELHHVADPSAYPPYNPPQQRQRDVDGDGIQDLFGPALMRNSFAKVFDPAQPMAPSESDFDLHLGEAGAGQYGRVMLLQDQPSYGASVLTREAVQVPSGAIGTNDFRTVTLGAVYNEVVLRSDGALIQRVRPSGPFRGVTVHHAILYMSLSTMACVEQMRFLTPGLTQIPGTLPLEQETP